MVQRRLSHAQENPVTAIDIALEPDAKMVRQAEADNARLLKANPEGFALDATHHAHITILQQFVRTAELEKVYSAANAVLAKEGVASRRLKAIKYSTFPLPHSASPASSSSRLKICCGCNTNYWTLLRLSLRRPGPLPRSSAPTVGATSNKDLSTTLPISPR